MAEAKKRKGTALLAVMDENCSSCAGSPICEAHCPVDDCINLLYEETAAGRSEALPGVRRQRQMHRLPDVLQRRSHQNPAAQRDRRDFLRVQQPLFRQNRKPVPPDAVPKRFQLQLIGTESEDRLDKKICPWDAIKMYEFDDGLEASEYFYDITKIKQVNGMYVIDAEEKARLEDKQSELYD